MLAAALGKSSEDFPAEAKKDPLPSPAESGQPSAGPNGGHGLHYSVNRRSRGFGHWKNEYPEGRRNKSLPVAELINIETEEGCRELRSFRSPRVHGNFKNWGPRHWRFIGGHRGRIVRGN